MKTPIRVTLLCVCFFVASLIDRLSVGVLHPVVARLRIPAPEFTLNEVIRAASHKYQVPSAFIKSVIAAESAFSQNAVSAKGAIGLMQLMPETARQLGADPSIPEQNVDAGANYLSSLLRLYANKKNQLPDTIAAYNAGPGAVARYKGVPPYHETRAYVSRVLRLFAKYQQEESGVAPNWPRQTYQLASLTSHSPQHWRARRGTRRVRLAAS